VSKANVKRAKASGGHQNEARIAIEARTGQAIRGIKDMFRKDGLLK
jgi:hypothetical protein